MCVCLGGGVVGGTDTAAVPVHRHAKHLPCHFWSCFFFYLGRQAERDRETEREDERTERESERAAGSTGGKDMLKEAEGRRSRRVGLRAPQTNHAVEA